MIKFNYRSHEKFQISDTFGEKKYNSKHLYNLVFRNDYENVIERFVFKVTFPKRVRIIRTIVENPEIKITNSKNTSTLTCLFLKKDQTINIDFLVADATKNDKIEISSKIPEIKIRRTWLIHFKTKYSKKIKVYKGPKDWKLWKKITAVILILGGISAALAIFKDSKELFFSSPKKQISPAEKRDSNEHGDSLNIQKAVFIEKERK